MGILDRLAVRVAAEVAKAPQPILLTEQQMRQVGQGYGNASPLDRDPSLASVPFGPGSPLIPGSINPLRDDGRADPRRFEYLVAQNINITETRLVPFKTLRAAADQIDILRRCVEVLKMKLVGLDWDIVLAEDAVDKIIEEQGGGMSGVRAMQFARDTYTSEIARCRNFWEMPDRSNGLNFADWLGLVAEEVLVVDAWATWPQRTVSGNLLGLQVLDGSTIKPLIDDRGMRPQAPFPAYQQVLYGFPRTEFNAPDERDAADGEFTSDELAYYARNRRTTSVYGYGPVERALPLADIYLRRQQWIRGEYTDGVLPELFFETDATFGTSVDLLKAYENVLNDDLAGQTERRKGGRMLPAGVHPWQARGYEERFKDVLDDYLVASICGHFGVLPTEIGFSPKGGLGGSGHQQGQAQSSEVIGLVPLAKWLSSMISSLSYVFLGMPRELEFRLMPSERQDTEAKAKQIDIEIRNGTRTVNEARSLSGLPLLDSPNADMPLVIAGTNTYVLTPEGITTIGATPLAPSEAVSDAPVEEPQPGDTAVMEARTEVKSFMRWLKKRQTRPFEFQHLPETYGEVLNKFVLAGDHDGAKWYAERYL